MEALEAKELEEPLLVRFAAGDADTDRHGPLAVAVPGEIDAASDLRQGLHQSVERRSVVRIGAPDLAVQQRAQQEGEDAVRRVHRDLLVGPLQQRAPTDELRILHLLEGVLDRCLAAISGDRAPPPSEPYLTGFRGASAQGWDMGVRPVRVSVPRGTGDPMTSTLDGWNGFPWCPTPGGPTCALWPSRAGNPRGNQPVAGAVCNPGVILVARLRLPDGGGLHGRRSALRLRTFDRLKPEQGASGRAVAFVGKPELRGARPLSQCCHVRIECRRTRPLLWYRPVPIRSGRASDADVDRAAGPVVRGSGRVWR